VSQGAQPLSELESADDQEGDEDAENSDDVDLEEDPEREGEQPEIERGRRGQPEHGTPREHVLEPGGRNELSEQLTEQRPADETDDDGQQEETEASVHGHPDRALADDQGIGVGRHPRLGVDGQSDVSGQREAMLVGEAVPV